MVRDLPQDDQLFGEEIAPENVTRMVGHQLSYVSAGVTGCTVRANGDETSYWTGPELSRISFREGGLTFEPIQERFPHITDEIDLTRPETLASGKYELAASDSE